MSKTEKIIPTAVMIYRGTVFQQILRLLIKAVGRKQGAGITDPRVLLQQLNDALIVIGTAVGIGQTDNVISYDFGQRLAVIFHLSDHVLIGQLRQHGMG